jgi:NAD(P)-dependent dehydrogenase (short-subunit alcohol dehydrogenase family)
MTATEATKHKRVLECKLAIVTGASRGIGAAVCANLASKGCHIVMNYTSASSASKTETLARELEAQHGIKCLPVQADMSTETGPAHIIHQARQHFSVPPPPSSSSSADDDRVPIFQIDILINNAGVGGKHPLPEATSSEFTRLYNINVRGPLLLMTAALPYLPHDRSGRIVNLSSVSSSCGFTGDSIYGGTKAALEAMTRSWARELAERATVNAVNPGPVATDMYWANPPEFQASMAHWTKNTPLAKIRGDVDPKEILDGAELAGGRPVCCFRCF